MIPSLQLKGYNKLFIYGLLTCLAFAPIYCVFVLFFTLPFLLKEISVSTSTKEVFYKGLVFGCGYFFGGLYWVTNSLFVDLRTFWYLLPFSMFLIPSVFAIYIGLTSLCTYFVVHRLNNKELEVIVFAAFWIILEWIRGVLFTGFPWNLIVSTLCFSDVLLQPISLLNCYGYGFCLVILYCSSYIYKKKLFYGIVLFFVLCGVFGICRISFSEKTYGNKVFRIVQPNIEQNLKWDPHLFNLHLDKLITLSNKNLHNDIDYLVWPEAAIPYIYKKGDEKFFKTIYKQLSYRNGKLITGVVTYNPIEEKYYNSIIFTKYGNEIDYYYKVKLVPFGEFVPFKNFIPFVKKITEGYYDIDKGYNKMLKLDDILAKPIICYESIFYDSINVSRAEFILNLTNDKWFGNSTGPYQHFDNIRLRAIENNLPAVRCANSGISSLVNSLGIVEYKTKLDTEAVFDVRIPKIKSFYLGKIKEVYVIFFLVLLNCYIYIYFKRFIH